MHWSYIVSVAFATSISLRTVKGQSDDLLASCTQTDLTLLDACVASQIDQFTSTLDNLYSSTFDYNSIASEINSIQSGLTSFGITLSSFLPDPASFTSMSTTYTGPIVSDIVNSFSQYNATRTDTTGSIFSFDTSSFEATAVPSTSESPILSTSNVIPSTITAIATTRSTSSIATSRSTTSAAASDGATKSSTTTLASIAHKSCVCIYSVAVELTLLLGGLYFL